VGFNRDFYSSCVLHSSVTATEVGCGRRQEKK